VIVHQFNDLIIPVRCTARRTGPSWMDLGSATSCAGLGRDDNVEVNAHNKLNLQSNI